jgi:hypothetical protein
MPNPIPFEKDKFLVVDQMLSNSRRNQTNQNESTNASTQTVNGLSPLILPVSGFDSRRLHHFMNRNAGPHESFNFLCEIGPAPYAITRLEEDARSARTALQGRARRGAIPAWGPGCGCDWYMVVFHHAGRSLIRIR